MGVDKCPRDALENKQEKGVGRVLNAYYEMKKAEEINKNVKSAKYSLSKVEQDHANATQRQELAHTVEERFQHFYHIQRLEQSAKILAVASASEASITVGGGNGCQSFADSNRKQVGGTDMQFTDKGLHFGPHFLIGLRSGP